MNKQFAKLKVFELGGIALCEETETVPFLVLPKGQATIKPWGPSGFVFENIITGDVVAFVANTEDILDSTGNAYDVTQLGVLTALAAFFFELGGGAAGDLASVLANGNTSGANDISFDVNQGLLFSNSSRLKQGRRDQGLGGAKGVAMICSLDYQLKWEAGRLYVMDQSGLFIRQSLYNFTTAPTVNDDDTNGYLMGSLWSLDSGAVYICMDATTGAAQWVLQSNAVPNLSQVLASGKTANSAIEQLDYLDFDTAAGVTALEGQLAWNTTDGTLDLGLKGGNVTLQIGQEQILRVVNKTATNVNLLEANYQAVRVTGSQGQRIKVDLAVATNDLLSAETIGLVTETINNNQEGFITTSGLIRGINTTGSLQSETWADGDIVYLSPTVAGNLTNIKPVAPNHLIVMGYVVYAHAVNGTIFVKVDNGYELDELHNVQINGSLANNDALIYESSTQVWKNKTIGGWNYIVKSANQDVTNSITLVDDTDLQFSVVAGGQYMIELDAVISCNNTSSDYLSRLAVSAGTMKGNGIYTATSLTGIAVVTIASANASTFASQISMGCPLADLDSLLSIRIIYSFTASANATFKHQFAQNVAIPATTARTFKGSILKYKKIN